MKSLDVCFFLFSIFFSVVLSESSLSDVLFSEELNYTSTTTGIPDLWALSNGNKQFYNLGGNILIGRCGVGETVTRNFLNLPPHKEIRILFNLFQADSWESEYFILMVDGSEVYRKQYVGECSGCYRKTTVDFRIPHSNSGLEIVFKSNLNQVSSDESWGINIFKLLLNSCPYECFTCSNDLFSDLCNTCLVSTIVKTMNSNQKCFKCNSYCKTCSSETQNDCTSCFENAELIGSTCFCKNGYYLSSIFPFICKSGIIPMTQECIYKMTDYYNRVEVVHWCELNITTQITTLSIQLTPALLPSFECYTFELLAMNEITGLSSTNITNYKVYNNLSATIIKAEVSRDNFEQFGCVHTLSDEVDTFQCRFILQFKYKDLIQEKKEFSLTNTIYRKTNKEISFTVNPNSQSSHCLKDSCNITVLPKSSVYFCADDKCLANGTRIVYTRGETIYIMHSLEEAELRKFYELEKVSIILRNSRGGAIDVGVSATSIKVNAGIVYAIYLPMADSFGVVLTVRSILNPKVQKRRLQQSNHSQYESISIEMETLIVILEEEIHRECDGMDCKDNKIILGAVLGCVGLIGLTVLGFCLKNRPLSNNVDNLTNKQRFEMSCLTIKGLLERYREKRKDLALSKEKQLLNCFNLPTRSKEDEQHKAKSIIVDLNYTKACDIVIRNCEALLDNTIQIIDSGGNRKRIPNLLPSLDAILWAARPLALECIDELSLINKIFGKAFIEDAKIGERVDQKLKDCFEIILSPITLAEYFVNLIGRNGISLQQFNQAGHGFIPSEGMEGVVFLPQGGEIEGAFTHYTEGTGEKYLVRNMLPEGVEPLRRGENNYQQIPLQLHNNIELREPEERKEKEVLNIDALEEKVRKYFNNGL